MLTRGQDSVTGPELLLLIDENDAGDRRLDLIRSMADDYRDVGRHVTRGLQHMLENSSPTGTVEHFRIFRLHAGALARRKNQHSKIFHNNNCPDCLYAPSC